MVPLLLRCRQIRMSTWESGKALGVPTVPLSNGLNIPILGLGTSHQGGYSHEAVVYALQKCGIRHIDTAKRYGCESLLQKAIKESGIEREDLWITTKLWHADYGYDKTKQACLESCNRLGVEYLDLYLIHWPDAQVPGKAVEKLERKPGRPWNNYMRKLVSVTQWFPTCGPWSTGGDGTNFTTGVCKRLKKCYDLDLELSLGEAVHGHGPRLQKVFKGWPLMKKDANKGLTLLSALEFSKKLIKDQELYISGHHLPLPGICKSIGVSNFLIEHLEQLREDCQITPHVNQVEYHPFQRPQELVEYCQSRNIVFEGYCPLAKGEVLNHPNVVQLAKKYGKTAAQICIRWSIQNGIVTIPKSTKPERVQENCQVFDFSLDFDDVAVLNGMHDGRHVSWDPTSVV